MIRFSCYLEDDINKEVNFNGETLTSTLHLIKRWNIKRASKYLKTKKNCVGQKHYSGTENIVGEIRFNKETGREINLLVGQRSERNRKKSMIVSNNTIEADFFIILGKKGLKISKNW